MFNPFDVFGLPKDATLQMIRARYTQLLKKYHPDTAEHTHTKSHVVQTITDAYSVLKDEFLRNIFVHVSDSGLSFETQKDFLDFSKRYTAKKTEPEELQKKREEAQHFSVTLSLEESLLGIEKKIVCQGTLVFVTIPPNTQDQAQILYKHQVNLDTVVNIEVMVFVAPHKIFKREKNNLVCQCPISFREAVKGGKAVIPTPYGGISVDIPPFSQGKRITVAGRGVQGDNPGDLIIMPFIVPPPQGSPIIAVVSSAEEGYSYDPRPLFTQKKNT